MKTIKISQWLLFLKTAITNKLGITNINQSVAYIAVLDHEETVYSISLPATINKTVYSEYGAYIEQYYIAKMIGSFIKNNIFLLCLLAIQLIFIILYLLINFKKY